MRLDCRSLQYKYFPWHPQDYRLVLLNSQVKHELANSAYNDRRKSCENVAAALKRKFPGVNSLRDANFDMLDAVKGDVSDEDALRAKYVIGEKYRVMEVSVALEEDDYEEVGRKMFETHYGLSKEYEVSCPEIDFLNDVAKSCGVTGSRIMGGGFGGCTINLVSNELYDNFVATSKQAYKEKFGIEPIVIDVVIGDGSRRLE